MTAPVQPQDQPQPPSPSLWENLQGLYHTIYPQGLTGAIQKFPGRMADELQGMAKDPYNAWIGMVGTGELGDGGLFAHTLSHPEGFTLDPMTGKPPTAPGYLVADPKFTLK